MLQVMDVARKPFFETAALIFPVIVVAARFFLIILPCIFVITAAADTAYHDY
jgi:hypothetical protein